MKNLLSQQDLKNLLREIEERDTLADLKEKLAAAQARAASNTSEDGDDTTTGDETKELEDLHARIADFEAAQDRYATYFAR